MIHFLNITLNLKNKIINVLFFIILQNILLIYNNRLQIIRYKIEIQGLLMVNHQKSIQRY